MFLMATSAIGPGFITQTTAFTVHGAAFAFAILVSILVDIAVQANVWRIIGGLAWGPGVRQQGPPRSRLVPRRARLYGRDRLQHRQYRRTGLGTNAMMGLDPKIGGAISAVLAILIFLSKRAGVALDRIVVILVP